MRAQCYSPFLQKLSDIVNKVETQGAGAFLALMFLLLVFNITTRFMGMAQFWVDEAAVMAMTWMAFLAASVAIKKKTNIAMTLVADSLPLTLRLVVALVVDAVMLLFSLVLLYLVWGWFDPLTLWRMGGDVTAFSLVDFNFIYEEPTSTLGIRKFWVWLILPLFALTTLLHSLANLDTSVYRLVHGENN